MVETTRCGPLWRAMTTNYATNGYPSRPAETSRPTKSATRGVVKLSLRGESPNLVKIVPYGVGNADTTFSIRVLGWQAHGEGDAKVWDYTILFEAVCTLGTRTGLAAGSDVTSSEKYCDTIVPVTAFESLTNSRVVSPADNTKGHILVDAEGSQDVEVIFTTGGSATSCNALVGVL